MKFSLLSLSLLISILSVFQGKAQPAKAVQENKAAPELENTLLWEISGNGLEKPSFLYGTIHLICKSDLILTEKMKAGLTQTQQLVLEIDMDEPGFMMDAMKTMVMPGGKTIKQLLSPEDYKLVNTFFKDSLKMELGFLGNVKPLLLSSFMYPKVLDCPTASYEETLMQFVKQQQKPVQGLETVQDQMDAIDKISLDEQAKMLVSSVKEYDKSVAEFRKLLTHYKANDLGNLYKDMQQSEVSEMTPQFEAALLNERNQRWIPLIQKMAKEKPSFFAVGAGHLAGKSGLINLLRQQGYTVKGIL